jgi:hypothetical protein
VQRIKSIKQESLMHWIAIPVAVGVVARFIGLLPALTYLSLNGFDRETVGQLAEADPVDFTFIALILFAGPLIETLVSFVLGELLRKNWVTVTIAAVASVIVSYFYHGGTPEHIPAAFAFGVFTLYYIWLRNQGFDRRDSYIRTALSHSAANVIALIFIMT